MDRIRLIASDMDATLLDEHSCLPAGFADAVHALAERGIRFAAASGRPLYTLEQMFAALPDPVVLIGDNGGAVRWQGQPLFVSEMAPEGWRELACATRAAGHIAVLCGLERAYVEHSAAPYDAVIRHFYTCMEYVDDLTAVCAPADKFTVYLPQDNAQEAFDTVYAPLCRGRFSVAVAGSCWVDVMNPGVHKGAALAALGQRWNIVPAQMMAFGDTFNDAEMLCTAKYGFLMENGSPELRPRVPFLAASNREQGVMQVLRRVLVQDGWVSPADFAR
ncbi:MAG: HAD family hydrolase [Faecalibacterium sp.]